MPEPLDASRVYRWQAELIDLVVQVTETHEHNETVWIEWKSSYDLSGRQGQQQIARHILGFANRPVSKARQYCKGHAYLIVGADPEQGAVGIETLDLEKLVPAIESWVGPAVRWHPNYVSVGGKQILVVVVEPPEDGDPIFPLRRDIVEEKRTRPSGRVFVRRQGGTHEAGDSDIDDLSARAAATGSATRVGLASARPIESYPKLVTIAEMVEAEKRSTLDRPLAGPAPGAESSEAADTVTSGVSAALSSYLFERIPEKRTREEYEAEVEEYIGKYEHAIKAGRAHSLGRHRQFRLALRAENFSDTTLEEVIFRLMFPDAVAMAPKSWTKWRSEEDLPEIPTRPDEWGLVKFRERSSLHLPMANYLGVSGYRLPGFSTSLPKPVRFKVISNSPLCIEFTPMELRALDREVALPEVALKVHAPIEGDLECNWTATSRNARGQDSGTLRIPVIQPTFSDPLIDISGQGAGDELEG